MTRTMITLKAEGVKFTYRVGGIVVHDGRILFQKANMYPEDNFWFLPGGRAELGESAAETLRREMLEELGVEATIERTLFLVENFFTYGGRSHHELGLYFLMTFPTDSSICQEAGPFLRPNEDDPPMIFEWLPIDQLEQFTILPSFFCSALRTLPEQMVHIVHVDKEEEQSGAVE